MSDRTIDMTRTGWGHAYSLMWREESGDWHASLICKPRPADGDSVLIPGAGGDILEYRVVGKVDTPMDPGDQHFTNLRFTGNRHATVGAYHARAAADEMARLTNDMGMYGPDREAK